MNKAKSKTKMQPKNGSALGHSVVTSFSKAVTKSLGGK